MRSHLGRRSALSWHAMTLFALYFSTTAFSLPLVSLLRHRGIGAHGSAVVVIAALGAQSFCPRFLRSIGTRFPGSLKAKFLSSLAVLSSLSVLALSVLLSVVRPTQPGVVVLSIAVALLSLMSGVLSAVATSAIIRSVGWVAFCRVRVAGTFGFAMACVAMDGLPPLLVSGAGFLALAVLGVMGEGDSEGGEPGSTSPSMEPTYPEMGLGVSGLLLLGGALALAARPFELGAHPFLQGVTPLIPGTALMMSTLAEGVLFPLMPRFLGHQGAVRLFLVLGAVAWILVYGVFGLVALSWPRWLIVLLPVQGLNAVSQTILQGLMEGQGGDGALLPGQRQAALSSARTGGSLAGSLLFGLASPSAASHSSSWLVLWGTAFVLAVATGALHLVATKTACSRPRGPAPRRPR